MEKAVSGILEEKFDDETKDDDATVTIIPKEYEWWSGRRQQIGKLRQQIINPLVRRAFAMLKVSSNPLP